MNERKTIVAHGPETTSYLHGQLSQDIEALEDRDTAWSLILEPAGKLVSFFRIHRVTAEEYLLEVDEAHAAALIERLERYRLRTAVTFEVAVDRSIPVPLEWSGISDPDDERQRILAGLPRMGSDLTPSTIPGEGGRQFLARSVSFTKGCYTGQELVARIESRGGNVPRPLRVLVAEGPVAVDDEVTLDGDVVGKVSSAHGDAALAPLVRRVGLGDVVSVAGVAATVTPPVGWPEGDAVDGSS